MDIQTVFDESRIPGIVQVYGKDYNDYLCTLSAAEVKALASGNPMIKESVELADELQKLNSLKRTHDSAVIRARTNLQNDIKAIASLEMSIEARKEDLKKRKDTYSEDKFSMQIGGKTFSDRKDAGEALLSAILSMAKTENEYGSVGGRVDWDYFVSIARIGETDIPMVFAIRTIDTDSRSQIYSIATKESPTILRGDGTQNQSANAHPSYEDSSGSGNRVAYPSDGVNTDYTQNQQRTNTLTDREILSMAADKILTNDSISMDAAESDALDIFKKRLAALDSLQEQRRDLGRTYSLEPTLTGKRPPRP